MKFFFSKSWDNHYLTHLVGSYLLTVALYIYFGSLYTAATISFSLGVLWELLDGLNYWWFSKTGQHFAFLDKRGGDFMDLVADFCGVGLCVLSLC